MTTAAKSFRVGELGIDGDHIEHYWIDDRHAIGFVKADGRGKRTIDIVMSDFYPGTHEEWSESTQGRLMDALIDEGVITVVEGELPAVDWRALDELLAGAPKDLE